MEERRRVVVTQLMLGVVLVRSPVAGYSNGVFLRASCSEIHGCLVLYFSPCHDNWARVRCSLEVPSVVDKDVSEESLEQAIMS